MPMGLNCLRKQTSRLVAIRVSSAFTPRDHPRRDPRRAPRPGRQRPGKGTTRRPLRDNQETSRRPESDHNDTRRPRRDQETTKRALGDHRETTRNHHETTKGHQDKTRKPAGKQPGCSHDYALPEVLSVEFGVPEAVPQVSTGEDSRGFLPSTGASRGRTKALPPSTGVLST